MTSYKLIWKAYVSLKLLPLMYYGIFRNHSLGLGSQLGFAIHLFEVSFRKVHIFSISEGASAQAQVLKMVYDKINFKFQW